MQEQHVPITVWTKPVCMQCNMVKKFFVEKFVGRSGIRPDEVKIIWTNLVNEHKVRERDLTAESNAESLEFFKGLGYSSAPITEYKSHAVPGFIPAELATIFEEYKHASNTAGH